MKAAASRRSIRAGASGDAIGPERAIGCVVHPAADLEEPGVVRHTEGERLPLGEPSGEKSERALALSRLLVAAGFRAPVRPNIRSEIWVKLWGNLSFNPISALTGGTLAAICREDGTRDVARAMMLEAQTIAEALGIKFPIDVDKRIAGAAEVGEHKTSMLQDLELGRPDGGRCPRHRRPGARAPHRLPDADHRHGARPHPPARRNAARTAERPTP